MTEDIGGHRRTSGDVLSGSQMQAPWQVMCVVNAAGHPRHILAVRLFFRPFFSFLLVFFLFLQSHRASDRPAIARYKSF